MKANVVEPEKIRPVLVAKVQQMDAAHLDRLHRIIVKLEMLEAADELQTMADAAGGTNDLAARARSKKLSPMDVQDATFTITNPGVFGSLMGTPIIPLGTAAIMGLGAIEKRAKVITGADGEDTIAIRTCAYFSISFDHRIVDGADADRFMADVKKTLESFPETSP